MTYVVNEACIRCKYTDCVEVCPVDCFYSQVPDVRFGSLADIARRIQDVCFTLKSGHAPGPVFMVSSIGDILACKIRPDRRSYLTYIVAVALSQFPTSGG
jgi:predicted molibdopterin-dependent oxidoreductase YjgC